MIDIGTKIRVKPDRWHGETLSGEVVDVWSGGLLVVEIEKGRLTCTVDDLDVLGDRRTREGCTHVPAPARSDA